MALDAGTGGIPQFGGGPHLAVAAIFKNEGPYILEWVACHRVMGVDRFFIADNNSTDETTNILGTLAAAGIVTHIPFPTPLDAERPPQLLAYEKILADHSSMPTNSWCRALRGAPLLGRSSRSSIPVRRSGRSSSIGPCTDRPVTERPVPNR